GGRGGAETGLPYRRRGAGDRARSRALAAAGARRRVRVRLGASVASACRGRYTMQRAAAALRRIPCGWRIETRDRPCRRTPVAALLHNKARRDATVPPV